MAQNITLTNVGLVWPDGSTALTGITGTFGAGRTGLVGSNGSGKSTLLEALVHSVAPQPRRAGGVLFTERGGYLPQRLAGLDDAASVLENVRALAPSVPAGTVRNQLARFLLRGATVERAVNTLSGGERFRVALARLLLADPPPQQLVLDDPTNNLDRQSVDQLVDALLGYSGALIVVNHDDAFWSGCTRRPRWC